MGHWKIMLLVLFLCLFLNSIVEKYTCRTRKCYMNTCIIWDNGRYSNKWETVLLCFYCAHCEHKLQDSVKFKLETFSLFFSLSQRLFLNRRLSLTIHWLARKISWVVNKDGGKFKQWPMPEKKLEPRELAINELVIIFMLPWMILFKY